MNITTEELKALLHKAYLEGQTGYQDLRDETIDGIVANFVDGEQIVRQSNWKAYPAAFSDDSDDSDDDDWDQDWETPEPDGPSTTEWNESGTIRLDADRSHERYSADADTVIARRIEAARALRAAAVARINEGSSHWNFVPPLSPLPVISPQVTIGSRDLATDAISPPIDESIRPIPTEEFRALEDFDFGTLVEEASLGSHWPDDPL